MNHDLNIAELFSSVREDIQRSEFEKRNENRLKEGKAKAKEWLQVDSYKLADVYATIKLLKPSTIKAQAFPFPLNPWYIVTDLGYVYRLHQWNKVLNKDEVANNEDSLRWQLAVDGKLSTHKIYINQDKITKAKEAGYKVYSRKDKKNIQHHWLQINNAALVKSCIEHNLVPFEDNRCKAFSFTDAEGNQYQFATQKEAFEKMFAHVVSYKTFCRALKNAQGNVFVVKKCRYSVID